MTSHQSESGNHAVVLAGGLGTRIASVLGTRPKALADVAGRPFLDWKLDELRRNSIEHVTFLLGHGSEEIIDYLEGTNETMEIQCIVDGPHLLGTGGALANALDQLPGNFFLTYGDNLLEMPYRELSEAIVRAKTSCALAVSTEIGPADQPNSVVTGSKVTTYTKTHPANMTFLDYGVMLLGRSQVEAITQPLQPPFELAAVLSTLADSGELAAAITELPYWEIGTPQTLEKTAKALESQP